jgi:hypothetical protein
VFSPWNVNASIRICSAVRVVAVMTALRQARRPQSVRRRQLRRAAVR